MRRRRTSRLTLAAAILVGALPAAGAQAARPQAGELLVGFRAGVSLAQQQQVLDKAGAKARRRFGRIRAVVVSGRADLLRQDPRVRYVEPNRVVRADADPAFRELWGLENVGQLVGFSYGLPDADTDAPDAWTATEGAGVVVAVLDTGVDSAHPDLASQMWRNPGETAGNGADDDGNGYVDDVHGWDFTNGDGDPRDDNGHGTHVAGTVAAARDNGVGVAGVAPGARVMAVKFLDEEGLGTLAGAVAAVLYADANGADVINASWGDTEFSQALLDAVESVDALVVASAGNSGSDNDVEPHYPSGFELPNVVSVAATDNRDRLAWFSNVGARTVDLGAPGVSVYSTWPGGGYQYSDGTSMAAPHVSGAAALAHARLPGSNAAEVKALLLGTADRVPALAGTTASGGRLNANAAVRCTGPTVWLESPVEPLNAYVDEPLEVRAHAHRCGSTTGLDVQATANGAPVELTAAEGVYTGSVTPSASGSLTVSVTATADGQTVTRSVTGNVSPVLSVVPGGPPVTVTAAAGQNPKLRFAGTAGDRISVAVTGVTIWFSTVTMRDPQGAALGAPLTVGTFGGFLEPRELAATGTYSLLVDPNGTATGSMTLTVYAVPPDSQRALPFATPTAMEVTVPGQNARGTFTATAGRRVSLKAAGSMSGARLSILAPGGTPLAAPVYLGSSGGFVEPRTLPADGDYTVLLDPGGASTGTMTLTLYDVPPDAERTLAPGTATAVEVSVPGQNARATFAGSAGQVVSLKAAGPMSGARLSLVAPDGSALGSLLYLGSSGAFVEPRTLPADGEYTVFLDPAGTTTGTLTLTLYHVPADAEAALVPGTARSLATSVPGQNARGTFTGSAGATVSLRITSVTVGSANVSIRGPDGSVVAPALYVGSFGGFVEPRVLPVGGTYTVLVDPQGTGTGSVTLTLYDVPPDAAGSLLPGTALTLQTGVPGQKGRAAFPGVPGRRVSVKLSPVTASPTAVTFLAPDGSAFAPAVTVGPAGAFLEPRTLATDGDYAVVLDPQGAATGSVTLTLYDVPADVEVALSVGTPATLAVGTPGQNGRAVFGGVAGQPLTLRLSGVTMSPLKVWVAGPEGTTPVAATTVSSAGKTFTFTPSRSGTHTLNVDPQTWSTGSVTLSLS